MSAFNPNPGGYVNSKDGHPQFKSALLQLRNIADNQSIAELQTKKVAELRFRIFKIWLPEFRNSQQFPASSATF